MGAGQSSDDIINQIRNGVNDIINQAKNEINIYKDSIEATVTKDLNTIKDGTGNQFQTIVNNIVYAGNSTLNKTLTTAVAKVNSTGLQYTNYC